MGGIEGHYTGNPGAYVYSFTVPAHTNFTVVVNGTGAQVTIAPLTPSRSPACFVRWMAVARAPVLGEFQRDAHERRRAAWP